MKKRFYVFLLAFMLLPCAMLFTGCRKMDKYNFAIMPDTEYYSANVVRTSKLYGETSTYNFDFARTTATIAGEQRDVMYLEYSYESGTTHTNYTLLFVQSGIYKAFYLDGTEWKRDASDSWSKWNYAYGDYNYYMYKRDVWGRDFPQDIKKTTDEYIEYDFGRDEEVFRLANNGYHYLLYYHMKTSTNETNHNAIVKIEKPTITIEHLDTLTAEKLAQ